MLWGKYNGLNATVHLQIHTYQEERSSAACLSQVRAPDFNTDCAYLRPDILPTVTHDRSWNRHPPDNKAIIFADVFEDDNVFEPNVFDTDIDRRLGVSQLEPAHLLSDIISSILEDRESL